MNWLHFWKKFFPWQTSSKVPSSQPSQPSFSAAGTLKEINAILDHPKKWYIYQLEQAVKKLEQSRDEFINHHQHQPELLFKKMYQSIGTFFKAFHIRKLYNTNPSLSLEEYCKLPLFQQAMNNVIDKKKKLLPSSLHKGGNCVYWSMFFLHFIESWRIPGLEVKLFTSTKGHTFLRMKFKERYYKLNVYGTKGNKETLFPSPYPHLYEVAATPELAHFFSFSGTNQQQIMKFQKECQLRNEIWLEYNGMEHNKVGVSISAGRIEIFEEEGSCVLQLAEFSPCEMWAFSEMSQKQILKYLIQTAEVLLGNKEKVTTILMWLADKIDKKTLIMLLEEREDDRFS